METFWEYFISYWINTIGCDNWNISEILKLPNWKEILIVRSTNGIERFHRKMNERFGTHRHPSMHLFVTTLKEISKEYVSDMKNIKLNRLHRKEHPEIEIFKVPVSYLNFTI
jgi:hypothetical protein